MRAMRWLAVAIVVAATAGCAALESPVTKGQRLVGADEPAVQAQFGPPRETYPLDGGTRWLYPTKPYGQFTYAADFDAGGKLVAFKQVLSSLEFAQAKIGVWTRDDVLRHFGQPVETAYFPRMERLVWSYRFKADDVWPSLMHFYFDPAGVLQLTQITPDPLYDPDRPRLFRR
ncbi:hypothetical protein LMG19089_00172 [Ralstonia edaphis]|uniref:hypothetical protein n=1 Tax=Ralstonia TaxID=48736 RepID=UPI000489D049|nr:MULTISPECIES: hypothetical protein [unclassified Ralstonia]CAJ0687572.1 hypothetical protein LMG19089_00172 [Ralstonia sp. LMG 6871]